MRQSLLFVLLAAFLFTGCDFFRVLAGRPTSADIENGRLELLRAEEQAHMARIDSLKREQQILTDSLAALDSIRQNGGTILNPSALGGLFATRLEARYYIIIGSFRNRANAEALLKRASDKGYAPALISFRNGLIAVGLCPVNTLKQAVPYLKQVRTESFCPPDVWILVNE